MRSDDYASYAIDKMYGRLFVRSPPTKRRRQQAGPYTSKHLLTASATNTFEDYEECCEEVLESCAVETAAEERSVVICEDESYLRDAIERGLRYDDAYCLGQNLFRFKAKMALRGKETLWRWRSYEAYVRRRNEYHAELDEFIDRIKEHYQWKTTQNDPKKSIWHDGAFVAFEDAAMRRIERRQKLLDRKYPKTFLWNNNNVMSRAEFRQRDLMTFDLLKKFLGEKNVGCGSLHQQLCNLDQGENFCLTFAAVELLKKTKDIPKQCALRKNTEIAANEPLFPALYSNCCQVRRNHSTVRCRRQRQQKTIPPRGEEEASSTKSRRPLADIKNY